MVVDKGISPYYAYAYLCSELYLCFCLAPDDRPYKGLVQADDPVLAYMDMIHEHLLLLFPHLYRGEEQAAITRVKREETVAVNLSESFLERVDISSQAGQHVFDTLPDFFLKLFPQLNHVQIPRMDFLQMSLRPR
jgi:hypothetical protein